MISNLTRTAQHWATPWQIGIGLHWTDLPFVQRRLNSKVSTDSEIDWLEYTLRQHFADNLPMARCYSLGCGHGEIERRLARLGAFATCEASDLSAGAIAEARRLAAAEEMGHIEYTVTNANSISLAAQQFDAVWAHSSVHHFEQLEHVFFQVARALKPGGLFILNEYIGPNRFQFPQAQRQAIKACLHLIPAPYRRLSAEVARSHLQIESGKWSVLPSNLGQRLLNKLREGDLIAAIGRRLHLLRAARDGKSFEKTQANLPTKRSVIAVDPSEAIRSADIVPVLQQYFDIVEFKPLGGTILQFLLADIAGNFDHDEAGERLLQMLCQIEDSLIEIGVLQSDFAYIVAKPKQFTDAVSNG